MKDKKFGVERRVSKEFDSMIRDIQKEKIKNGTGDLNKRKTFSSRRITLAITRHSLFKKFIVPDIIKQELE